MAPTSPHFFSENYETSRLTEGGRPETLRPVNRNGRLESSIQLITILAIAALSLTITLAGAAVPFTRATVTRTQNKVTYGQIADGKGHTRAANAGDIVGANSYVLTESESRAELQYDDGSVVRIGQNTVFSFEANTRTLSLKDGAFTFFIPRGQGGGTIKTPSLTAAITGTVGKVSRDTIAVLEGEVTLIPSGRKVKAGEFARKMPDGSILVARFDPIAGAEGALMNFNGPMPGFREDRLVPGRRFVLSLPDTSIFDAMERTQNQPSSIDHFNPPAILPRNRIIVPQQNGGGNNPPPY